MIRDMKTLKRKKYQRAFNKAIRKFNKNIKDDWLWNGRFVMRQAAYDYEMFHDKSGALFHVLVELKDMKTGKVETKWLDNYDFSWKAYEWANYCITETWDVWLEDPNPNQQARLEGRVPD